jgi:predicted nucleic acid-binding protein
VLERVVIDTNVLSYFLRPGDSRARQYEPHVDGKLHVVSFVTVAELHRWRAFRNWGRGRSVGLDRMLAGLEIVHSDDALCRRWGEIAADWQRTGISITEADAWIAVTALELGAPLVTHNRRHFEPIPGLVVISEA